jgi:hypothetical protein
VSTARIQIYSDPETKRRVEVAAIKSRTSVTDYCLGAIRARLAEDGLLEPDRIEIEFVRPGDDPVMARIRELRLGILEDRHGEGIDVDTIIEQIRAERSDAILGLR